MTDFGTDLSCVEDLDSNLTVVSGRKALSQAIARRLITPKGSLWYDPEYGFDVRQFLNAPVFDTGAVESGVEAEALKDERVEAAISSVTFIAGTLFIGLNITDGTGPFDLTIEVTSLTVALLTPSL